MDVEDLLRKYALIRELRGSQAPGASRQAPGPEPATTAALRALAESFPGALRELDELPMQEIERRIALLEHVHEHEHEREAWIDAALIFHPLLRGALVCKRWLARRREVDADVIAAFEREVTDTDARVWRDSLHLLARPPRGRIIELVLARVAAALPCSKDEARTLCLGAAAAARAARRGW